MLKCILDGGTATEDKGNVASGLYAIFTKDSMDSITGLCREVVNDRLQGVPDMNIGLVF